ncbi:MAG: sigma factor, partial [bacterium]
MTQPQGHCMMNCQNTMGIAIPPIISRKPGLLSSVVSRTGPRERLDDAALLQRIGPGDHRAYGVLVRRCLPKLLSVARRYTGNATEAEDIVQEALTRLWVKAPTWDQEKAGRASITTWLYRIVVN